MHKTCCCFFTTFLTGKPIKMLLIWDSLFLLFTSVVLKLCFIFICTDLHVVNLWPPMLHAGVQSPGELPGLRNQ